MAPQPQRREQRRTHLDASVVPVERALLARAHELSTGAMQAFAVLGPEREDKPVICDRVMVREGCFAVALNGRQFDISAEAVDRCGKHPYGEGECGRWFPTGHENHIRAAIDLWDANCAKHDQAATLPLVVLAGLR